MNLFLVGIRFAQCARELGDRIAGGNGVVIFMPGHGAMGLLIRQDQTCRKFIFAQNESQSQKRITFRAFLSRFE